MSVQPPCNDKRVLMAQPSIRSEAIIVPTDGVTSFSYGATDTNLRIFELPAIKSYNMGNARLRGTFAFNAAAAANNIYILILNKKPGVSICRYQTRGNLYVSDNQSVHKFTNCYPPLKTTVQKAQGMSEQDWQFASNNPAGPNTYYDLKTSSRAERNNMFRYIALPAPVASTSPTIVFDFPLKDLFPDSTSFLSLDKYLAWPEIMQLQLTFGGANFDAYQAAVNVAGSTAFQGITASSAVQIASLALYLDIEMNDFHIKNTLGECLSGQFGMPIPYMFNNKQTMAQNTTTSAYNIRLGNGYGQYLRKVIWTLYSGTESSSTTMDHSNVDGGKLTSFYELIDQNRIYPFDITCTDVAPLDMDIMSPLLRNSIIGNRLDNFRRNFVWETKFDKVDSPDYRIVNPDNLCAGLDLTKGDRQYTINFTLPGTNQTTLYIWLITERLLTIDETGVHIS